MLKFSNILKLNESLDPGRLFKYEINMTRSEIAEDIKNINGIEINSNDSRLTDEFCDKWVRADSVFFNNMLNKEAKEEHNIYIMELLKNAKFEVIKKEINVLDKNIK